MADPKRWVCNVCGYVHEGPEAPEECPQCGADRDQFEEEDADEDGEPEPGAKRWVCSVCGYVHEGPEPPEECPQCAADSDAFEEEGEDEEARADAGPQRWVCSVCGYVHEGPEPPEECPQCGADRDAFEEDGPSEDTEPEPSIDTYLSEWARKSDDFETQFNRIHELAKTGKSETTPMRTQRTFPNWTQVLFLGAPLERMPLNEDETVSTETVIGATADKPLKLALPFYVSHMSFGALGKEAKIALAKGAKKASIAMCSGEGGLLPEERAEAGFYIYELGTAAFSHSDDAMKQADAVEIKLGQAAKPGLGGHLPAEKVTEEIAKLRGLAPGEASVSPGRYTGIDGPSDLKAEVDRVRDVIGGRPVGVKITAGHIEADLEAVLAAGPDFITIDCRGGGTGSAPTYIKDNVCLPPIFALHRTRNFLDAAGSKVSLCVTGGFRDSMDIAKAIAMGADAVALATASLLAIGCQQYRICHTGKCPVGITTHDPKLRARFNVDLSTQRFVNFCTATQRELETIARINGRAAIHDLDLTDLVTLDNEISANTDIPHA